MEEVELLLKELQAEGFETDRFEGVLRAQIAMGLSPFRIKYEKAFGEELMRYQLVISKGEDGDSPYRLTELVATHRDPVDIEERVFKGINTRKLDNDMARVDWHNYFFGKERTGDPVAEAFTGDIISKLVKLANMKKPEARYFQQLLMYKHWPEDGFEIYRMGKLPNLKNAHEHTYTFSVKNGDSLNANLAFMMVSEKHERLWGMLQEMGLRGYGLDIDKELRTHLRDCPEKFTIDGSYNDPMGYVKFSIPIAIVNEVYTLGNYQLTLTPYPKMQHGIYNGIDTGELEIAMQSVDWKNDHELFLFSDNDVPELAPKIERIQEQLHQLSQDIAGGYIAGILQLKYMQEATFFEDIIEQNVWNLLERLPKIQREFPPELEINVAANLLCGRAVAATIWQPTNENQNTWISLNLFDDARSYPAVQTGICSKEQLLALVRSVPQTRYDHENLCHRLMQGDLIPIKTTAGKFILMEADPKQESISLSTPDGRPIPVNFHLDPDWIPPVSQQNISENNEQKAKPVVHKFKMARPVKKGKGKGL